MKQAAFDKYLLVRTTAPAQQLGKATRQMQNALQKTRQPALQFPFNSLWPQTTIATAAVEFALGGDDMMRKSRRPEIMADAAHVILCRDSSYTGNFLLDEAVLREVGVTAFSRYSHVPGSDLETDIFVEAIR